MVFSATKHSDMLKYTIRDVSEEIAILVIFSVIRHFTSGAEEKPTPFISDSHHCTLQNSGTKYNTNPPVSYFKSNYFWLSGSEVPHDICKLQCSIPFLVSKIAVIGVTRGHFLPSKCYEEVTAMNVT